MAAKNLRQRPAPAEHSQQHPVRGCRDRRERECTQTPGTGRSRCRFRGAGHRRHSARGPGHDRRTDRLYGGHAGAGSRPGGGPGDRHGQAGGGVRQSVGTVRPFGSRRSAPSGPEHHRPAGRLHSGTDRRRLRRTGSGFVGGRRTGGRRHSARGASHGRRADRIHGGHAGAGSRPGGGSGDRHGQAGGGLRTDLGALRPFGPRGPAPGGPEHHRPAGRLHWRADRRRLRRTGSR